MFLLTIFFSLVSRCFCFGNAYDFVFVFVAVCFFLLYALVFYVYCLVLPDVLSLMFFHVFTASLGFLKQMTAQQQSRHTSACRHALCVRHVPPKRSACRHALCVRHVPPKRSACRHALCVRHVPPKRSACRHALCVRHVPPKRSACRHALCVRHVPPKLSACRHALCVRHVPLTCRCCSFKAKHKESMKFLFWQKCFFVAGF